MTFTQSFTLVPSPETPALPYFLYVIDTIVSTCIRSINLTRLFSLNDIFRLSFSY